MASKTSNKNSSRFILTEKTVNSTFKSTLRLDVNRAETVSLYIVMDSIRNIIKKLL